ncbi:right-handed parallel beta-helix repeat-containing protein [Bradyrhizobium genosp. L]|uniref:right-handed parallel beta-helix repeat-containing protein n=1 Tax=Bradyrhizobium genosp. L TaxID=83637 RepID=UPI0018A326D6|nr:right-handed parallel beta-helix repeat-containing protein [Bradyrhizobium genosp. L]QPF81848.1 right-handed parallel beta-helix repeat-containing protein [Bradyrhizobium genosp. L]
MKRLLTLIAIVLTAAAFTVQLTSLARAQNSITYLAGQGQDTNGCFINTPCQSLSVALGHTSDGGAIQCVDAGYFGSATITISVVIDCVASGGGANAEAITINAPGKIVTLRNIAIDGFGRGGIDIIAAASVYLENVLVSTSFMPGIKDHRAGPGVLVIRNSSIVNIQGVGILVAPSSGTIGAELDNVSSAYNSYGLAVGSGGRVMIKNSVFTANTTSGIQVDGGAFVGVSSSQISFNSTGIATGGTVAVQNSSVNSNTTAISGATQSLGNNLLFANIADGTAPTIISGR